MSRHPARSTIFSRLAALPGPVLTLSFALVYLGLAQFVIWLNDPVFLGAGFWPAAGVSLGFLLILPTRKWIWIIGAIVIAEFGGNLIHSYPVGAATFWTLGNCIEPLVGATLIRKLFPGPFTLVPLPRLVSFIALGVVLAPLVGATMGSLGTIIFLDVPALEVWPKYFVGDALGVLVMAPLLLMWRTERRERSLLETLAIVTTLLLVTILVFRNWNGHWDLSLPYLIVPLMMWAALRFGVRGTALATLIVANVANLATAIDYGPFAGAAESGEAITLLQIFLGATITSSFVVAALVNDLFDTRQVEARLTAHNDELTAAVDALEQSQLYIRKLEGVLPICMSCKSVRTDDDARWVPLDVYLMESEAVALSHGYCPTCARKTLLDAG